MTESERKTQPLADIPRPVFTTPWIPQWQPEKIGTLLFIEHREQVLLIHKKRGHGAGKVNAPGGKWQPGETLEQCAIRETLEEVGLQVQTAQCRAELRFVEQNGPQWLGYAFVAHEFSGELQETDEADPFWCPINQIPFAKMWPDDAIWLPLILSRANTLDMHEDLRNEDTRLSQEAERDTRLPPLVGDFLFNDGQLLEHQFSDSMTIQPLLDQQNLES